MADIKATSLGGIPKGTTANRPTSPAVGDVFYNGTLGCLEIYTAQGWVANSAPPAVPTINSVSQSNSASTYAATSSASVSSGYIREIFRNVSFTRRCIRIYASRANNTTFIMKVFNNLDNNIFRQ